MNPIILDIPTPVGLQTDEHFKVPTESPETIASHVNLIVVAAAQRVFGGMFDGHVQQDRMNESLLGIAQKLTNGDDSHTIAALLQISATARALAFSGIAPTVVDAVVFSEAWDSMLQLEARDLIDSKEQLDFIQRVQDLLPIEGFDSEELTDDRELLSQGKCPCPKHRAEAEAAKGGKPFVPDPDFNPTVEAPSHIKAGLAGLSTEELLADMPPELRQGMEIVAMMRGVTIEELVTKARDGLLSGQSPEQMVASMLETTKDTKAESVGGFAMPMEKEPTQDDVPRIAERIADEIPNLTPAQRARVYADLVKRPITDFTSGKPLHISYGE